MLRRIRNFRAESGHCWTTSLPSDFLPGDSVEHASSSLRVFENGSELGPGHAAHTIVREKGCGAFSHWGTTLYFSTSDNSDPRWNRRQYFVVAPGSETERALESQSTAERFATDHDFLHQCVRESLATQGSEFHALASLRNLRSSIDRSGLEIRNRSFLEVGGNPSLGLPLALLLLGAERVAVNNVLPLSRRIAKTFVRNLATLLNLECPLVRSWEDTVVDPRDSAMVEVRPDLLALYGAMDAADLPSDIRPFDIVFSFSVFEHMRRLPKVLEKISDLTIAGGTNIHWIDMRDHTNFSDPLKYLRLSQSEFAVAYGEDHNRWRMSDYVEMLHSAGFEAPLCRFAGSFPVDSATRSDMWAAVELGPERLLVDRQSDIQPKITEAAREQLSIEFRTRSAEDLSVLVLEAIVRKPLA